MKRIVIANSLLTVSLKLSDELLFVHDQMSSLYQLCWKTYAISIDVIVCIKSQ